MRIAVYFEESATSLKAFNMAEAYARQVGAELFALSTITREDPIKHSTLLELEADLEAKVKKNRKEPDINCECRLLVDIEDAGEQIVKFVERKKIDWLYIGTPKKSKMAKLIVGSTSLHVILNATCPVITINDQVDLKS